ncbi:MAG: hypothetical protein GY861_21720 [bacterium]|nr:hypothetical protein [bacterium]
MSRLSVISKVRSIIEELGDDLLLEGKNPVHLFYVRSSDPNQYSMFEDVLYVSDSTVSF